MDLQVDYPALSGLAQSDLSGHKHKDLSADEGRRDQQETQRDYKHEGHISMILRCIVRGGEGRRGEGFKRHLTSQ